MKINKYPAINLPDNIDLKCIKICNLLNRLPNTRTYESCEGHGETGFWIFFFCYNIDVLSRLGRCINHNYSDGNWEIVVDSTDIHPRGCFWLRTKTILPDGVLNKSLDNLIKSILYWFDDKHDEHFS